MSALGRLVASVVLDTAEFTGGTDKAQMAAAKMATNIDRQMRSIESSVKSSMVGIGAAIGAGFSIAALNTMVNETVKAAAALDDMSEKTGASVETLSGLVEVAKIGGHEIGTLEQAMTKLAKGGEGTSRALGALGISAKDASGNLKDTGTLTQEIAGKLIAYADGTGKAAIAQDLFGKSGAQLLPFLKDLALSGSLVVKTTTEQAAAAETYEKTLNKLAIAKGDLVRIAVTQLVPTLQVVADMLLKSKTSADGTLASVKGLAEDGSIQRWGEQAAYAAGFVVDAFSSVATAAKVTGQAIAASAQIAGTIAEGVASGVPAIVIAEKVLSLQRDGATQIDRILQGHKSIRFELDAQFAKQREINAIVAKYAGGEFKDARDLRVAAGLQYTSAGGNAVTSKKVIDDSKKALEEYVKAALAAAAADDELAKSLAALEDKQTAAILGTEKQIENIQFETSIMGLSNDERQKAIALRALETSGIDKQSTAYETLKGRLTEALAQQAEQHAALEASRLAATNQVGAWNDLASVVIDTFRRGKDALKDFARSMLELFARKYILQIGAGLTGSTALSASAEALGQGSAAGSLGNLLGLGSAGGLFGSSAAYGAAIGTTSIGAGSQAAMLAAQTGEFGAAGLSATAGSAGGMGSMMAAAGPYVAFALAAYGLYKAFAQKAGGPKEGGSFTGMFNDIGALGTGSSPGWYGVNTANANVQQLVTATGLALGQSISRYGGSTSGFGIGLGYDADPRGTAQSRITSYLKDATGAQLFGNSGMEIGRGNEGVALQLEMSRLLVEGLKASNINEQIKALFTGFDTASATQASIDALIASAEELNSVLGMLASVTISGLTVDSLKAMQAAGESLAQTASRVTGNFAALQDLFSTDAEKMARDQQLIADAFASINVAVPDSIAGFKALIDSLDLSTDSGRSLYNVLIATGPKFKQIQDSMTGMLGAVTQSVVETYNAFATVSANIPTYNPASGYTPGNSEARASLADQLRASLTSEASPYTLAQKYATAKAQFDANLTLAQSGNADAISASFGLFQNFTGLSRQVNASSGQYNTDYFGGLNALGALTAGSARPFTAADYTAGNAQVVQALNANFNAVAAQTAALIENATEINAETVAILERIANATEKPASPGALTSTTL